MCRWHTSSAGLDAPFAFTPEHLEQIEGEMRKICKEKLKLERFELPRAEALAFMEEKGEPFTRRRWSRFLASSMRWR